MSGRLVILPKKSWNVWNIENREKVLKDEREHREQLQAAADKSNKLVQEQTLNVLRNEFVESTEVAPFRLFADIEAKVEEDNTNAEYMKEKKRKDDIVKKREGIADWEFGEGSYEVKKLRPWYESVNPDISKVPAPQVNPDIAARELERKAVADPMAQYVPKPKDHHSSSSDFSKTRPHYDPSILIHSDALMGSDNHKSHKKDKKKDKKHHKEDKLGKKSHRDKELEALQKQAEMDSLLQELRRRGLDSMVQTKSSVQASSSSSAGTGNSQSEGSDAVDSKRYSQQYNPQIAKHRKTTIE